MYIDKINLLYFLRNVINFYETSNLTISVFNLLKQIWKILLSISELANFLTNTEWNLFQIVSLITSSSWYFLKSIFHLS
jgi:hypothetical protein